MATARFQIVSIGARGSGDVSWRFLSGNNRSLARSVPTYPDVDSCMAAIRELREKLPTAVGSTVRNGSGTWTWRIRAADFDLAVSSGRFERRLRARMACESFMEMVVAASTVDVVQVVRF